jgi:hypothetical protein
MTTLVSLVDIWLAKRRFMDVVDDMYDFEIFLGYPNLLPIISGSHRSYTELSEFTAHRIALLCSEHYRAIIKAWVIVRNDLPKKDPK